LPCLIAPWAAGRTLVGRTRSGLGNHDELNVA
jgi:hypothetical protein